ncbi:MAG: hypothetical protein ABIN69_07305 [Aestuariivirga sp.]
MPSILENRLNRLEQTSGNAEAPILFFTVRTEAEREALQPTLDALPANAVVFITQYETRGRASAQT